MVSDFFNKSVFAQYFTQSDAEVQTWVDNVVDKLFKPGIVANYIRRGKGSDAQDADYIAYWTAVVTFYAYLVKLSRVFENFEQDNYLARQYLLNLNTFVTDRETLEELQFIISNRLRDMSRRGTIDSTLPKPVPEANGEMLRLTGYQNGDLFKIGTPRPQFNSWNINNSGPCFRGTTGRYDLNCAYEFTEDVDITKYPLLRPQYITQAGFLGKVCMKISGVPGATESGIYADGSVTEESVSELDPVYPIIPVNPYQNFEISFYVGQDVLASNIKFGVVGLDLEGNPVNFQNVVTGADQNIFFQNVSLNQTNKLYFVRGIIYNCLQANLAAKDAQTTLGLGTNLRFKNNIGGIIPYIVDQGGGGAVYLWNIKVTPSSTFYSRCFLNNKNFFDIFTSNNNGFKTNQEIKEDLRRYFIPYNTAYQATFLKSIRPNGLSNAPALQTEDSPYLLLETGGKTLLQ